MYQYLRSICLARTIGAQWRTIDLSNALVFDIYATYYRIYHVVKTPFHSQELYVDFNELRLEFSSYHNTLHQWFIDIGNRTLPYVDTVPNHLLKFAKYSDGFFSGYRADLCKVGFNYPSTIGKEYLPDIKITRPRYKTDLSLIHTHCLVSINGLYHLTDTDDNFAYVYQAGRTNRLSNQNQFGILSFLDIGEITKIPITPDMVQRVESHRPLKEKLRIAIPDDLTMENKSIILVLGGYLVFEQPHVFWRNSDNSCIAEVTNMPYLERVIESQRYIDLSSLGLDEYMDRDDIFNKEQMYSDPVLRAYFSLSQSYLAVIDTPSLFTKRIYLRKTNSPGHYLSHQDPVYPLVAGQGKMLEYWKKEESQQWSLNVTDPYYKHYVFREEIENQLENITPNLTPYDLGRITNGYLLEIAGY